MNAADWLVLGMTACCGLFLVAGAHLRFDLVRARWQARVRSVPRRALRRRQSGERA
jgi:NADH:ubiquinone oxidoreductase subunit B-like Fe-S oxidoreductase